MVTVSELVVAEVTVACVAPNHTMSFAAVVLKFAPAMVTVLPGMPDTEGLIGPIVGAPFTVTTDVVEQPDSV